MKTLPLTSDNAAPLYGCVPIHSIAALAKSLGISELRLHRLAAIADHSYRLVETKKADGTIRQTFDAHPSLKFIQIRIKERILSRVVFPSYLNGSLKGRSTRMNAEVHVGAKITISEDISNFFPSTSNTLVKAVWHGFFRFSDDVATLLMKLTTKDGALPQGAVTSSYLANLVFWHLEPALYKKLKRCGYQYTRYVDDISISCKRSLNSTEWDEIISSVYTMLRTAGLMPKRQKHEIRTARSRVTTTKLVHNVRVALPKEVRRATRAAVYQLEQRLAFKDQYSISDKELRSASSRVGRLSSFHPVEGAHLKTRLMLLRAALEQENK